jgi:sterol desaturase/sphingolipid hydroxylase (fatty acid hydroxylase superfamily)
MNIDLDTGKLVIFLGGLLLFLGIETLAPKRPWRESRFKRLIFHGGIAALNTILIRLLIYVPLLLWIVYVEQQGWGISRWLGLKGWVELLATLVVIDLFDYFWHRANHRVIFLWRFHKAHHTDTAMDVTTALRFHPGELMISALAKAIWIAIWGPTAIAWFLFEAMVSLCAQFHHSNVDFPDRVEGAISALIVTPRFHASHHAVHRQYGDANFSTIFSLWDRLLHTYERPEGSNAIFNTEYGLGLPEARDRVFSPRAWLSEPFQTSNLNVNNRKREQSE